MKLIALIIAFLSVLLSADLRGEQEVKSYRSKFEQLEMELEAYSPAESPWGSDKIKSGAEWHLLELMRVEVRLWGLKDHLAAKGDDAHYAADQASQTIHSEVLNAADTALRLMRNKANQPFAKLLVHHLEAYPYDWSEEGWENLLPNLRKLILVPRATPHPKR